MKSHNFFKDDQGVLQRCSEGLLKNITSRSSSSKSYSSFLQKGPLKSNLEAPKKVYLEDSSKRSEDLLIKAGISKNIGNFFIQSKREDPVVFLVGSQRLLESGPKCFPKKSPGSYSQKSIFE